MSSVIEVQNLKKSYTVARPTENGGREFEAVRGVGFSVEKGEIFGILGPNGAGKTTTLEIIEGIKQQTSGRVTVLGLNNITNSQDIKKRIGVQLQSSEYLPALSLVELLNLFGSLYGLRKDPHQLLGFVGLQEKASERVKSLSGGQKQRFTIATSLVNDPEIIFLDEPTTGLDPRARRDVWNLIKQINGRGVTVVMTTHYMEEAEFLCNRVAIMDHGRILKIDEPKRLINDLSHTTQVSFLTSVELPAGIWSGLEEHIEKVYNQHPKVVLEVKSLDIIGRLVETLKQHSIGFSGFTVKTASLEDVYLDLTGKAYEE
ncbi:MAG: ABC transporter ATP-binding protein [Candidatus Doudnabacteria bacterium]|nr:ABC transporter ATP-binding protein [Candidatus Doudnabacteria bacterium]